MKKTLLILIAAVAVSSTVHAQKVWNFSVEPFGVNAIAGGSAAIDFTKNYSYDGLTIGTDGTALFGLTANSKTIDGTSYTYRLQTGGGGGPVAPSKIPVTRYLSFNVSGASTINIGMISSNSSTTRTLIIVNENESVVDSIVNIGGASALTYTYAYTGPASKLYLYSRNSGINYYYVSATNVVTGINEIFAERGVFFQGNEVVNNNNLSIEIFDVLGKKLGSTTSNFNMKSLPAGIYMVKSQKLKGTLKFVK